MLTVTAAGGGSYKQPLWKTAERKTEAAAPARAQAKGADVYKRQEVDSSSKSVAAESQAVSAATEEQSASMEEIAASSRSLANLAQELQEASNRFRL